MSTFDEIKKTATDFVKDNKETVKQGIETAGDTVDNATGGKYKETVDTVQSKAHEVVDGLTDETN